MRSWHFGVVYILYVYMYLFMRMHMYICIYSYLFIYLCPRARIRARDIYVGTESIKGRGRAYGADAAPRTISLAIAACARAGAFDREAAVRGLRSAPCACPCRRGSMQLRLRMHGRESAMAVPRGPGAGCGLQPLRTSTSLRRSWRRSAKEAARSLKSPSSQERLGGCTTRL